ncbi:TonB-dependent receptor [Sphingomonas sp. HITSZ_GF]|uniref:TonB-dependent receptor n=1 Tax=Sphingomonas sp. HITSZ_GF TaxID=3037247 RepID=UPI00240D50EC|nr:TonB-dependent receptor [Sphingomonas sp. HITSZ_GF]MDG2534153.1 TonB-dependent receptor [Sphingomonas sp. HITSZ_GF]
MTRSRMKLLAGAALAVLAPAAHAQTQPAKQDKPAPKPAEDEIVVTGKAPPGAVIGDIPPENQLGQADIAGYGVGTVSELLDAIAEQTSSAQGREDEGPVVLVNGKRISGVNEVADLPTESIVRVDILPEEVALKYGYDAQRKVVNIILRRRFEGRVANLSGGMATAGQGENQAGDFAYTRIRDNDRVNIAARAKSTASLLESERDLVPATSATAGEPGPADDRAYRTLKPATRSYGVNATIAHQLSPKTNVSANLRGDYSTSDALNGLAVETDDSAGTPVTRFASTDPLAQNSRTATLSGGVTLNSDLSKRWRLSAVASYSHGDTRRDTDRSDAAGAISRDRATSLTDSGSASLLVNGKLLRLPAGDASVSLRTGADFSALSTTSMIGGVQSSGSSDRTNASGQISLDLPLASRAKGVLPFLGKLTANLNAAVTDVSDYGTLGTFGYGLNWTPVTGLSLIAAVNEDRVAPTLAQRGDAVVITSNVRAYDYATGETVTISRTSGGNPLLKADDRHVFKLGLTAKPWTKLNLSLTANYNNSRTENAIVSVSDASPALEEAFPDRFTRDAAGQLVSIDARSVNIAREDREQLRWGINFTQVLRAPKRPTPPPGFRPPWMRDRPEGGRPNGETRSDRSPEGQDAEHRDGPPPGEDGEIVVNGREMRDPSGPRPDGFDGPPDGFGPPPGPPPEAFGPPPGGFPGGPGGPGGFGPPPGGFRGGPGGPGGGGSDNGARFQFSLYHSVILRDAIVLRDGMAPIDLMDGGTLGGTPRSRHSVQLNTGVIDNGVGIRLSGNWKSAADVTGSAAAGDLHFGALATFELRVFANLANRFRGQDWARGTRVSLSIANLLNQRQKVTDATGATPLAYQGAYLDPDGRTLLLSIRRIF